MRPPNAAPLQSPATRVMIVTATRWEFEAVRAALPASGPVSAMVIRAGIGAAKAEAATHRALTSGGVDLVVSSGYAAALGSARAGDVLIGTEVRSDRPAETIPCATDVVMSARRVAGDLGLRTAAGAFVGVPAVICTAAEKRALATRTGAVAADMESAAVARAARAHRVPFVIIRAASDLVEEDLPMDFNEWLTPARWPRAVLALLRPSCWRGLARLRRQARAASANLTVFFRAWLRAPMLVERGA